MLSGQLQSRQQMANLNRSLPKYFLFNREKRVKLEAKVRTRSDVHWAEQAPHNFRKNKITRRMSDMGHGVLTPNGRTYEPVGGWPFTNLNDLVLNVMRGQLDEKIYKTMYRPHLDKPILRRTIDKDDDLIRDKSDLYRCPMAGFDKIQKRLKVARLSSIMDGFFFLRDLEGTRWSHKAKRNSLLGVRNYEKEEVTLSKIRSRQDELRYVESILRLIETIFLIKINHLKSTVPLNLDLLGKQRESARRRRSGKPHNFIQQIISQAPAGWTGATGSPTGFVSAEPGSDPRGSMRLSTNMYRLTHDKLPTARLRHSSASTQLEVLNRKFDPKPPPTVNLMNKTIDELFPKPWPPLWLTLAAEEQGRFTVGKSGQPIDAHRPSLLPLDDEHVATRRVRSTHEIMRTRKEWADLRQKLERDVVGQLERYDKERIEFCQLRLASLTDVPLVRPFAKHRNIMDRVIGQARRARQQYCLYDCEITGWYMELADIEHRVLGKDDMDLNRTLSKLKMYIGLNHCQPKFVKAKVALIFMSTKATEILHIHTQRAFHFILTTILKMPPDTLSQWLGMRRLPLVLC